MVLIVLFIHSQPPMSIDDKPRISERRNGMGHEQWRREKESKKKKSKIYKNYVTGNCNVTEHRTLQNTRDVNRSKNSTRLAGLERSLL